MWLDPDDTDDELRSIQSYALSAGKPWEYNYVIDGQGIAWEYAGQYRAAHSSGENDLAYGVLLLVGFSGSYQGAATAWEQPTSLMIDAVRQLRALLVDRHWLASTHQMRQHCQMPDAATACPGDAVKAVWSALTTPWTQPPPQPQPPSGDDDMELYLWQDPRYANVFLVTTGTAFTIDGDVYAAKSKSLPLFNKMEHSPTLFSLMRKACLRAADMQQTGGATPVTFPPDLA